MFPLLMAGASLLSNVVQGNVARDTATRQLDATQQAFNQGKGQIDQAIGSYDPYAQAGTNALQSYQNLLTGQGAGSFANNPAFGYQQQLLNQQLAKSRQSVSPTALGVYSTPLIAQEYTNTLNRLMPLMNQGFSATGAQAGLRGSLAQMYMNQGTNQANALQAGMPRYDQMLGNAMGTYMGASQGNAYNALADFYTKKSGGATNKMALPATPYSLAGQQQNLYQYMQMMNPYMNQEVD